MLYSLEYTFVDPQFPRKSPLNAMALVHGNIAAPPSRASSEEIAFLSSEESSLDSMLIRIPGASDQIDSDYVCDSFLTPVRIARKDSALCVVFTGLVSNAVYDSYSHTARTRAQVVAEGLLLPILKMLGPFAASSRCGYLGVAAYYPTSAYDTVLDVPEMLMIVSPTDECSKFSKDEITEDDLLENSDVFLADIDTPSDVRKIKLVLQ